MKLRPRLLSMVTITGMVMSMGIGLNQAEAQGTSLTGRAPHYGGRPTMVVNQDQLQGKWKQFKGELKKQWAEFTEDDILAIEGKVDKLEGKIQERYGDRREELKKWVDDWFDAHANSKDVS